MFRKLLIATALLAASGSVFAHGGSGYGRVVSVEPYVSFSFGTGHHDGFRVIYESGGRHYWTHSSYHPGHVIVVPHHRVHHIHHYTPRVKHHHYTPQVKHHRHAPQVKPHHRSHSTHSRSDNRRDWDHRRQHDRRDHQRDNRRHDR